ncbi:MAG TPA: bifunctional YncE family protein/alkaline phosphatase family protein, partial [Pirellulaceae bacterium]|nr:bifunctional YncE family protein/alkaline phosphatase family protein [Pirellulaceae bacterium]
MKRRWLRWAMAVILGVSASGTGVVRSDATAQEPAAKPARDTRLLPGAQPSGKVLLPTQWSLKPAGKQLALGDFPVNIALHPKDKTAAILHAGYGEHEVVIVDLAKQTIVSRAAISETFVGLAFTPDGKWLLASGAGQELIHRFKYAGGYLSDREELKVGEPKEKFVPAGLSIAADGRTAYAACTWGHTVCVVNLDGAPSAKHIKLQEDDYPYSTLPSADGKRLYVSLWGKSAVAVIDLATAKEVERWKVDSHPTELVQSHDGTILFVACADNSSVHVISLKEGKTLEVVRSALYPQADNGSTPNSLSLSPDGKVLAIANADNNNLALIDVSEPGHSRSLGFIPVGWYPTSVRFGRDDGKIYVTNGKGLMSKANRGGPNPANEAPATVREYIAGLFRGTLGVIDVPSPVAMAAYTRAAFECSPLRADKAPVVKPRESDNPIPAKVGDASPIKHCIYIIKENRTYDQVFGDLPQGNGDPALCIFPEKVTPNHHALATEFVLLDNFYVESEVSADGHEWSMAAYATDFVEKSWPLLYRGSREGKLRYPAEGAFPIARPSSGYIWDRCKEAGVSYRSYGEFVSNPTKDGKPAVAKVESLVGHFDPEFHGYDLDYPDVKRAARFIAELKRFEQEGEMPRFQIVRLPNDHTSGTSPGKPTPTAMVADNDLALGQLIEALSQSKFWKDTAVFVIEDDAQNGSDHVDAHRTVALVISPYTKRGFVDSSMYSTSSMLRTMELILGLKPMTQFDAAALPMYNSFQAKPDLKPYRHRPAQVDLMAVNAKDAWGAEMSLAFDLSKEDAADDLLLNEVVWRSVRGANSRMPAPVRAGFVF